MAIVELHSEATAKNGFRFNNHYCWICYVKGEKLVRVHASEREWFDMLTQAEQQTFIELMGRVQARFQQLQHSFKP